MTTAQPHTRDSTGSPAISDANRLGLDYAALAGGFGHAGPIIDIHTHIGSADSARVYIDVARRYGVIHNVSQTPIEQRDAVAAAFDEHPGGPTVEFIAIPSYGKKDDPGTFTTGWYQNIEDFRAAGSRIIKFWAAPRGIDFVGDALRLDSEVRREGMRIAYELGYRTFMTHVGDPDTWFATTYADADKYGTKPSQYVALERLMDQYDDVTWIGAHMSGYPEDLDFLQGMLDRHPNYVVDTSACKWMVRELSKQPQRLAELCRANPGRVLFGTDVVTNDDNAAVKDGDDADKPTGFDLYASRYWALRTLMETDYDGPSPIVDPDLHMVDPGADPKSTATLRGCALDPATLQDVYHDAAAALLGRQRSGG